MPEPRYRIVEPELSFSSRLTDGESQQLVQRRFDGQLRLRTEQHRASRPPKAAKVHAPVTTTAPVSRRVLQKANTPPLLDREREQLFQQFLEWPSRQRDMP
jgi:hypothetical protein